MKHRHRKEKKRFAVPTYFVVCRCGALFFGNIWINDVATIKSLTGFNPFEIARAMVPYDQLQYKNDGTY